jgi:hypothetical protein
MLSTINRANPEGVSVKEKSISTSEFISPPTESVKNSNLLRF